jgi:hypothetical protein
MGISVFPAPSAASKTRYVETLTSGTTYTVPAGVNYLNVTTIGGGGNGSGIKRNSYAGSTGSDGGTTTFTGATSAAGGQAGPVGNAGGSTGPTGGGLGQGGGEACGVDGPYRQARGSDGVIRHSVVTTSGGSQIAYAVGAGGGNSTGGNDANGGTGSNGAIIIEYWL